LPAEVECESPAEVSAILHRGLDRFYVARHRGLATDPVVYFAAPENQDLGVVKAVRHPNRKLIIAPFPDAIRRLEDFFFDSSPPTPLTTAI
jgi:hypothetical protein